MTSGSFSPALATILSINRSALLRLVLESQVVLKGRMLTLAPDSCLEGFCLDLLAGLVSTSVNLLLLGLVLTARLLESVSIATLLTVSALLGVTTLLRITDLGNITTSRATGTTTRRSTLRDGHVGRSAAEITLSSENLVVVGTELHAGLLPGIEMKTSVDAASRAVLLANRPVLLEGLSTVD